MNKSINSFQKFFSVFFLTMFVTISAANALLYVEPYVGYQMTTQTVGTGASEFTYKQNGAHYGAKVGASVAVVAFGLQYEMGSVSEKLDDGPTGSVTGDTKEEYDNTNLGAFVVFTALPLFNVWANYFFSSKQEIAATDGAASNIGAVYSGSGMGVGAGFTGLPFLSINLDYRMTAFDEVETSSGTTTSLTSANELDNKTIMLSVSAPFDF